MDKQHLVDAFTATYYATLPKQATCSCFPDFLRGASTTSRMLVGIFYLPFSQIELLESFLFYEEVSKKALLQFDQERETATAVEEQLLRGKTLLLEGSLYATACAISTIKKFLP